MQRKQFTFYRSFYEAVQQLPEGQREPILMAIIRYALDGETPEKLEPTQGIIFALIKPVLEAGAKKASSGRKGASATNSKIAAKKRQTNGKGEGEAEVEMEGEIEKEVEKEDECLFTAFWAAYPKKMDRKKAFALWRQLRPEPEAVMAGLQAWKRSGQWQQEGGRFIPAPARWLGEKMWTFAPKPAVPQGASGVLGEAELEALRRMMEE